MWPFRRTVPVTEEEHVRLRRKCGLMVGTLRHCLKANGGNPEICKNLEIQVGAER